MKNTFSITLSIAEIFLDCLIFVAEILNYFFPSQTLLVISLNFWLMKILVTKLSFQIQLRRRLGLVNTSATWAVCIGSLYTELRSALQKTLQILTGNIIWRKKKKNEDQNIHTGAMTNPKTEVDQTWCPGKLDPFIFECTHYDMQVSFPSRLT